MIKYFDIDSLISFNTNRIVNCLINKKLLNKQNLDMLMPIISEDFINCNSSYIRPGTLAAVGDSSSLESNGA